MEAKSVAAISLFLAFLAGEVAATVYRVGPGEEYATISEVADRLEPGDVVEVTGDITDSFTLTRHGTHAAPVTIRGATRLENGKIVRPRITLKNTDSVGIICNGDWNVLEGLEITGARAHSWRAGTAVFYHCDNLVIRNCYIHHNRMGIIGNQGNNGDILIEFCEFEANGGHEIDLMHSVYLFSYTPHATATVRFCYFHDGLDGILLKTRYPRNVIRYNWFESPFHSCVSIVDGLAAFEVPGSNDLHPLHSDIVGNVFIQGWAPGRRYGHPG